jgi:hypothetical protein
MLKVLKEVHIKRSIAQGINQIREENAFTLSIIYRSLCQSQNICFYHAALKAFTFIHTYIHLCLDSDTLT